MSGAVAGTPGPVKPEFLHGRGYFSRASVTLRLMARETGLEPATSGVTGRRSNQLSYSRFGGREALGREPMGVKRAAGAAKVIFW